MIAEHEITQILKRTKKLENELVTRIEKAEDRIFQLEAMLKQLGHPCEDDGVPS